MREDGTLRKKEKGEKTKRKLFESAAKFFADYEFENVTVDAIVEAAGVSKGTFYIYFESKEELIAAFLSDYIKDIEADYRARLALLAPDMPASDTIISLTAAISDILAGKIGYKRLRTVYKLLLSKIFNMEAIKDYSRELYHMFAAVLEQGMERGELNTAFSPESLARHFVTAIRGVAYDWCIRYPDFDLKEQALAHIQILLSGIKNEKWGG